MRLRRQQRLAALAEPDFPASGTERVAARVAEAKARERASRRS